MILLSGKHFYCAKSVPPNSSFSNTATSSPLRSHLGQEEANVKIKLKIEF